MAPDSATTVLTASKIRCGRSGGQGAGGDRFVETGEFSVTITGGTLVINAQGIGLHAGGLDDHQRWHRHRSRTDCEQ